MAWPPRHVPILAGCTWNDASDDSDLEDAVTDHRASSSSSSPGSSCSSDDGASPGGGGSGAEGEPQLEVRPKSLRSFFAKHYRRQRHWISPMWKPAASILKLVVHGAVVCAISICFTRSEGVEEMVALLGSCDERRTVLRDVVDACTSTLALVILLVFEMVRQDTSRLSRQVHIAMTGAWAVSILEMVRQVMANGRYTSSPLFHLLYFFSGTLWNVYSQGAVSACLRIAEGAFGVPLGYLLLKATMFLMIVAWLPAFYTAAFSPPRITRDWALLISDSVIALTWVATSLIAWFGFREVCSGAVLPDTYALNYLRSEAMWARRVIGRLRGMLTVKCASFTLFWLITVINDIQHIAFNMKKKGERGAIGGTGIRAGLIVMLIITDGITLSMMLKFCREQQPEFEKPSKSMPVLHESHSFKQRSDIWIEKVRELSMRSIDVGTILRFYERLGDSVMPHYDPVLHTTNDVVRAAIIPESVTAGGGGAAYSGCYGGGEAQGPGMSQMAECLVSHTWSMLFVHLVSAVVAHALGLDEYREISEELLQENDGIAVLKSRLAEAGAAQRCYWICAFCVNQHSSICGGYGPMPPEDTAEYSRWDASRRDSATFRLHPCCACREPKFFNDSPDLCELNKFDHMMEFMQAAKPGFRQLLVVDPGTDVFSRLWCVAECVQAHLLRLQQDVCLFDAEDLDVYGGDFDLYTKLATLSVAQCTATRPEDKEEIMAKIHDIPAFDAHLQALIFGKRGLLGSRMVGFDMLEAAACSAARVRAARTSSGDMGPTSTWAWRKLAARTGSTLDDADSSQTTTWSLFSGQSGQGGGRARGNLSGQRSARRAVTT